MQCVYRYIYKYGVIGKYKFKEEKFFFFFFFFFN